MLLWRCCKVIISQLAWLWCCVAVAPLPCGCEGLGFDNPCCVFGVRCWVRLMSNQHWCAVCDIGCDLTLPRCLSGHFCKLNEGRDRTFIYRCCSVIYNAVLPSRLHPSLTRCLRSMPYHFVHCTAVPTWCRCVHLSIQYTGPGASAALPAKLPLLI